MDSTLFVEINLYQSVISTPYEYDADSQELLVNFNECYLIEDKELIINSNYFKAKEDSLPYFRRNKSKFLSTLRIYKKEKDLGSYHAQNAFGVRKTIDKYLSKQVHLILPDTSNLVTHKYVGNNLRLNTFGQIIIRFPIEPNYALQAKKYMKIIAFLKLYEPYFDENFEYSSPTIDIPISSTKENYFIFANIERIWFYNSKTGQIYHKIDFM